MPPSFSDCARLRDHFTAFLSLTTVIPQAPSADNAAPQRPTRRHLQPLAPRLHPGLPRLRRRQQRRGRSWPGQRSLNAAPPARRRVARLDSLLGSRSVRTRLILRPQAPVPLRFPSDSRPLQRDCCTRFRPRRARFLFVALFAASALPSSNGADRPPASPRLISCLLLSPQPLLPAPSPPWHSPPPFPRSPAISFFSCPRAVLCRPPGAGKYTDFYL